MILCLYEGFLNDGCRQRKNIRHVYKNTNISQHTLTWCGENLHLIFHIWKKKHFWTPGDKSSDLKRNHRRCSIKKSLVRNFAISTGKHLCWSFFLINSFIKKRSQHRVFPVNIVKFLKTPLWRTSANDCF